MEDYILQQAKKYVAIVHGFKDWDDIDRKLGTGWANDSEVQEAALLDEVAKKYGEWLVDYCREHKLPEDMRKML